MALSRLEDGYREAIILRELEGFSYKEIAEVLKQNVNTVKTKIRRAREMLSLKVKHMIGSDKA